MHSLRIAGLLILTLCAAFGQASRDDATTLVVRDATPIRLRLMRDINFSSVRPGEMVDFEILDDLRIDGLLVIAHGMRTTATIIQAEPKTRMGRGGKLGVTLSAVPLLNGDKLPIRVAQAPPADPPAPHLLFTLGKDDTLTDGAGITVNADGDTRLDPARFLADILFTSNPPGALVAMYGMPVGRTPFTTRLAPGAYKVIFSADGFYDITQNITVGPGRPNQVNAPFEMKR